MLEAVDEFQRDGRVIGAGSSIPLKDVKAFEGLVPKATNWETLGLCESEIGSLTPTTGVLANAPSMAK
jgi:hypothetical protein